MMPAIAVFMAASGDSVARNFYDKDGRLIETPFAPAAGAAMAAAVKAAGATRSARGRTRGE